MEYPIKRELDGIYYRVQREGKWESVCLTDMTEEERIECLVKLPKEVLERMCNLLANTMREMADGLNIYLR